MTKEDLRGGLWLLSFESSMFQHFYAVLAFRFWLLDRAVKLAVAILAVAALILDIEPRTPSVEAWTFGTAITAVIVAVLHRIKKNSQGRDPGYSQICCSSRRKSRTRRLAAFLGAELLL